MAKKSASKKILPGTDETIAIPAVTKSNAGVATGAVVGAVAGPIGAILGGVVGAVLGKRAESGKPVMPDVKRTERQCEEKIERRQILHWSGREKERLRQEQPEGRHEEERKILRSEARHH